MTECLQPFNRFPAHLRQTIAYVLTDIDDTLTLDGRLPAVALEAMERLQAADIKVVPITGRPAGWCDHIARMWPVDALVGENGAFYFTYDRRQRRMLRRYWRSAEQRRKDRQRLARIKVEILAAVPGSAVAADQAYREADLAIDFCEDVLPLDEAAVDRIVAVFKKHGAQAKVSSIHVNGWFGRYDKLSMTKRLFDEVFGVDMDHAKARIIYSGDSPNDAPMFAYFPHAVGVANVRRWGARLSHQPAWITDEGGGFGFAEMTRHLLA